MTSKVASMADAIRDIVRDGDEVRLGNAVLVARLTPGQRKLVENALRDFRLAGVALPPEKKQRYKALVEQLATSFEGMAALIAVSADLTGAGDPVRLRAG